MFLTESRQNALISIAARPRILKVPFDVGREAPLGFQGGTTALGKALGPCEISLRTLGNCGIYGSDLDKVGQLSSNSSRDGSVYKTLEFLPGRIVSRRPKLFTPFFGDYP